MKKLYTLITGSLLLAASTTQLNAQCGDRYHDFIFPGASVTSNIVYGNNIRFNNVAEDLKLDVYQPQGDTVSLRPLIIFAHGGSFVGGSKTGTDMVPLCTDFAKMGYVTASIDYRLSMTNFPFGSPDSNDAGAAVMRAVHDARAAVRFFRKNFTEGGNTYGIDTSTIYFGGVSAGGFMALHIAYMDKLSEFPSFIDTTGITVGDKTGQKGLHGGIEGLSGSQGYSSNVKAIINISGALSDTAWMNTGDIPLISTHGINDGTVPYGTALIYLIPPSTYPITVVDGSSSVTARANQKGIVNCFKTYYVGGHVPESAAIYYDTTVCLVRNFLEHFTCGIPLNCNYTTSVVGINDFTTNDLIFNVYPNPAYSTVTIDLKAFSGKVVDIELYDAFGRKVKNSTNIKTEQYIITRGNLPNGIYLINVIVEGKLYSKKIMFDSH